MHIGSTFKLPPPLCAEGMVPKETSSESSLSVHNPSAQEGQRGCLLKGRRRLPKGGPAVLVGYDCVLRIFVSVLHMKVLYSVAKTRRMPKVAGHVSQKEPLIIRIFCGK